MKQSQKSYTTQLKKYTHYGAVSLTIAVIVAVATVAILPGPYHLDFFGVVAERTQQSLSGSSVTVSWVAILTALVIFPGLAVMYEDFTNRKS